jgi:hypothetical protein
MRRALFFSLLLLGGPVLASASEEECLDCHEDDDSTITFGDGEEREVSIDAEAFAASVHGKQRCGDCHRTIDEHPHPEVTAKTSRAYTVALSKTCLRCHYELHTKSLDGTHHRARAAGNEAAPVCVDCHGSHTTSPAGEPRGEISRSCAKCHPAVYAEYAESVHGSALLGRGGHDVPVCTDCHGSHAISDPDSAEAHTRSHLVCARCHGDAERMEPYGLDPDVVVSYLDDFHGMSNALYARGLGVPGRPLATCTDCHGTHAIRSFGSGLTEAGMKEKLAKVCARCHEAAPMAFGAAWMSHYRPTLQNAPLVWSVRTTYRVLIPAIVAGLLLHILVHSLHLRRVRRAVARIED